MLNGPKFIDTSLGKLLMFKGKVNGIMEKITAFTGAKEKGKDEGVTLDTLLEDIDDIQVRNEEATAAKKKKNRDCSIHKSKT